MIFPAYNETRTERRMFMETIDFETMKKELKKEELKRKLTPEQALTIEERRANGEKLHMILNDMNLLKK